MRNSCTYSQTAEGGFSAKPFRLDQRCAAVLAPDGARPEIRDRRLFIDGGIEAFQGQPVRPAPIAPTAADARRDRHRGWAFEGERLLRDRIYWSSLERHCDAALEPGRYSHSIVAGGLLVTSRKTASTPGSFRILALIVANNCGARAAKPAVIPSTELTGRRIILSPL